jgi:excisionase family DNA binding protein
VDPLLTPRDVAERCRLSTKTVLRAIHAGQLRASRLGAQAAFRIRPADVEAWIEACVVDAVPPEREAPSARVRPPVRSVEGTGDPRLGRLVVEPWMGRAQSFAGEPPSSVERQP